MIRTDSYTKLANHLMDVCNAKEISQILSGDFSVVRQVIVDELLLTDYSGTFLDIIFEDLFTQKKKPILKSELEEFADFLMTDISLYLLKYYLAKAVNK